MFLAEKWLTKCHQPSSTIVQMKDRSESRHRSPSGNQASWLERVPRVLGEGCCVP